MCKYAAAMIKNYVGHHFKYQSSNIYRLFNLVLHILFEFLFLMNDNQRHGGCSALQKT